MNGIQELLMKLSDTYKSAMGIPIASPGLLLKYILVFFANIDLALQFE